MRHKPPTIWEPQHCFTGRYLFVFYSASLRSMGVLFLQVIKLCRSALADACLPLGLPPYVLQKIQGIYELSSETSSNLSACLSLFSKQEGVRSRSPFRHPAGLLIQVCVYVTIWFDMCVYRKSVRCTSGPSVLEAFLQSKCRKELPSSTGSYQSGINKVFHLRQQQSLIRSQQQQQSSLLLKKKSSNYKLPDESAVFNDTERIQ